MRPRDAAELVALAALWGASFLFMRVAAPAFGPVALVFVRVALAAAVLLPLLLLRGGGAALRTHWRPIAAIGVLNSALPFALFTLAALAINAGLSAVFNATTPLWAAVVAWMWIGDRPARTRALGLAIGFAGVLWLAGGKASFKPGEHGVSPALAVAACLAAALLYGVGANGARRWLQGVPPLALATGSQIAAAAFWALPALWAWPSILPSAPVWAAALALAVACTALAYVLYFRLIANVGATQASSVTFLIPAFAIAWGWIFLDEAPTATTAIGCAVILAGTALATGLWPRPGPARAPG